MTKLIRKNILVGASLVGVIGGLIALAYHFILQNLLKLVWGGIYGTSFREVFSETGHHWTIIAITMAGGCLVGCCIKFLGKPGEIEAVVDNIHLTRGRLDVRQSPSMIVNSLISITTGGSAGPEAPLVQIIGSFASWLGERLKLSDDDVRTYTFCGMATALGAFFGAPIGGALFALEIPHRKGLEYYEALLPSCVAAVIGFLVFRGALGWERPIYSLPLIEVFSFGLLLMALVLGIAGALAGGILAFLFQRLELLSHPFAKYPILLSCIGGALIGLVAVYFPETLFWGEFQIHDLMILNVSASHFFLIALMKALAIGLTLHFNFRGGFIFPLFFIGAALGMGLSVLFPMLPPAVIVLSLMAAVNVAVTKTPISTTIILTTLSGTNLLPVVAIASFTSFLVASKVVVIKSQRSRVPHPMTVEAYS